MFEHRGILIVFEGIDGSGKSTQIQCASEYLSQRSVPHILSREPTRSQYGMALRRAAVEGRYPPLEELALFIQDRRWHVQTTIGPALDQGIVVLLDRYYFSTMAYQSVRDDVPFSAAEIKAMNTEFAPRPDLLLVFELPVEDAWNRICGRECGESQFEQKEYLAQVAGVYRGVTGSYVKRVDASRSLKSISREIIWRIQKSWLDSVVQPF